MQSDVIERCTDPWVIKVVCGDFRDVWKSLTPRIAGSSKLYPCMSMRTCVQPYLHLCMYACTYVGKEILNFDLAKFIKETMERERETPRILPGYLSEMKMHSNINILQQ
ncbi:hypothetical protein TWF132_008645 [Orbilia oligospora]|nr:hypothetical protein TWF132_008645 [Orbilia oligospora]